MNFNFVVIAVALTGLFGLAFVLFGLLHASPYTSWRKAAQILAQRTTNYGLTRRDENIHTNLSEQNYQVWFAFSHAMYMNGIKNPFWLH